MLAVLSLAVAAQPVSAAPAQKPVKASSIEIDPKEIMRVSEVRAGMRGTGRTVFRGTKIETFDVEVIGVLPKENLGRPLILVRMSGGPISERAANIIGGMSGSPVYINGRMVGAVAYGQTFPREPIAMLTPIEDMLEALDPALPSKPSWADARKQSAMNTPLPGTYKETTHRLNDPVRVGDHVYDRVAFTTELYGSKDVAKPRAGTLQMARLATPAVVSGVSARSMEFLTEALKPFGVEPMAGPGAMKVEKPITIEPGSAAGASLIVGDVDMTAVGTVTYRKGNQVLAFGHPFMQMGAVDLPFTTAWVHDVFPSIMRSFKIASPVEIVGSVRQDRPWGVGAEMGRVPDLIPVEVNVRDYGSGRRQTLRARVADNQFVTGQLIGMVTHEAVGRVRSVPGDATARVRTRIVTDGMGTLERENLYYDATNINAAALGDLLLGLNILSNNQWQQVDVRAVTVDVDIDDARRTAVIERAVVDREKYEPGDTVNVEVTVRPWEKEPVKHTLSVQIPEYAPNGRVTLRVQGGAGSPAAMLAAGMGGARMANQAVPQGSSLKQQVENYLEKERNNELVAVLSLPSFTANVGGFKMRTLPPPLLEVMRSPRNSGLRLEPDEVRVKEETRWVLSGLATISFAVERRSFSEKVSPTPSQPSAPTPTPPTNPAPTPALSENEGLGDDFVNVRSAIAMAVATPAVNAAKQAAEASEKPPTPAGAAAAEGDKETADAKGEKKPEVDATPVRAAGRTPTVWRQNTDAAFGRGRLTGAATSSLGEITLAPALEKLKALDATYVWSVAATRGAVYAGTGDQGVVYRVQNGNAVPVLKSPELQILALAKDSAGNVYAGTAPHGCIYRITPEGKSSLLWRSPEAYILSLAVDDQGNVYAGTSPQGRIYRVTPDGKGALLATVPDPYVVSLAVSGSDLYAGSGMGAVVYRVGADGKVSTFYDPAGGDTASLVSVDGQGRVYIGTSPRGAILRVDGDGRVRQLQEKGSAGISAMSVDARGVVWAASGNAVLRVEDRANGPVVERIEDTVGMRFLALALDEAGNVTLGTATGELRRLAARPAARGTVESAVRDAGSIARWGRLTWNARTPEGARVVLQTRTGNSEEPDATWSPWSVEMTESGQTVASPPGRYFQYRAQLVAAANGARPVITEVAVVYMPRNQEPKLTVSAPKGGEAWSKKQTIRWSGTDPDKDTLLYDIYASADGGKTWTKLNRIVTEKGTPTNNGNGTAPAETPEASKKTEPKANASAAATAQKAGAALAPEAPKAKSESLKETKYTWDTTETADGRYLIKIVASDRLSNPVDAHTVEEVVGPIQVANTPPTLALKGDPEVGANGAVRVAGGASATVPVAGVDYRVDGGEWASAVVEDGIFDGEKESFSLVTAPLESGEHEIEVRAVDAAGNHTLQKRKVNVP